MIYILIAYLYGGTQSTAGKAALAIEFNDLPACRAAAAEIRRQKSPDVLLCAAKGQKP